jgi:hypothetical protein
MEARIEQKKLVGFDPIPNHAAKTLTRYLMV